MWDMTGTKYRGFTVRKIGHTRYVIIQGRRLVTRLGSYWSCVCCIDEKLQA
jgi:hypothetical protein